MLHQTIPLYEGNLPFFYACYTEDDETLAFPILARMYNEGFRVWCARAGGVSGSNFRSVQRLSSSACVVLFMSRSMLELIRRGEPEMLAVLKSPLLRIVVSLDECRFDNSLFARSVPDCISYNPGSDAAFWLYTYSSEQLERCRGPWPEKKLALREMTAEELAAQNMDEEYRSLENIIGSDGSGQQEAEQTEEQPEEQAEEAAEAISPADDSERYPNQPGYIQPEKDDRVYIPLGTVRAAKSHQDLEYDEVMDMIDKAVSRQSEIIEAHSYAFPQEQGSGVHIAPPMALDAKWYSEQPLPPPTAEELAAYDDAFPEPQIEPKTDIVITPEAPEEEPAEDTAEAEENAAAEAETAEKTAEQPAAAPILITLPDGSTLPQIPMVEGGAAIIYVPLAQKTDGSPTITYLPINAAPQPAPAAEQEKTEAEEAAAEEKQEAENQETSEENSSGQEPLEFETINNFGESRQSVVSVLVRRQQRSGVRVKPIERSIVRPVAEDSTPNHVTHFSRQRRLDERLPRSVGSPQQLEQLVRDIALSVISDEQQSGAEEQTAPTARKFKGRSVPVQPIAAEQPEQPVIMLEAVEELEVVSAEEIPAQEEKPSHRKNRHPHRKGLLASLMAALRKDTAAESAEAAPAMTAETAEAVLAEEEKTAEETAPHTAEEQEVITDEPMTAQQPAEEKGLEGAIRRFAERNTVPRVQVVPRRKE